VLADVALLDVQVRELSAPQTLETRSGRLEVVYQREARDGLVVELFSTEPEHRTKCLIAVTVAAVAVRKGNADRCLHHGIAKQRFQRQVPRCLDRIGGGEGL